MTTIIITALLSALLTGALIHSILRYLIDEVNESNESVTAIIWDNVRLRLELAKAQGNEKDIKHYESILAKFRNTKSVSYDIKKE